MAPLRDTKQRLIATALELIWRSSYGAISVDDICQAAGVRKGSFYHFFPSKIDLAIAAMEASFADFEIQYDRIFSAALPALTRFSQLADYVYECQSDAARRYGHVCGCPCASLGSELAGQQDGIRAKFDELFRRKERYYESAVRDLVAEGAIPKTADARILAQEISAFLLGQMTVARIQNDLGTLRRDLKPGLFRLLGVDEAARRPETVG